MSDPILLRATPSGVGGSSFGPYPDLATLTATFPPDRHAGRFGLVGVAPGPYTVYQSDGSTWNAGGGGGFSFPASVGADVTGNYTVSAGDVGRVKRINSASAVTVTFPSGLGQGFHVGFVQAGAGQVTFAAGSGVTIVNRSANLKTAGQWACATAIADVADHITIAGDTSA